VNGLRSVPGGRMTLVAVNFFIAYALLFAADVFSGVEEA
jgi:hypothetical protein